MQEKGLIDKLADRFAPSDIRNERASFIRSLKAGGATALIGGLGLAAAFIAIGDNEAPKVDGGKPAEVTALGHDTDHVLITPYGLIGSNKTDWLVTLRQCEPVGDDCATETLDVTHAQHDELDRGDTVIPDELQQP